MTVTTYPFSLSLSLSLFLLSPLSPPPSLSLILHPPPSSSISRSSKPTFPFLSLPPTSLSLAHSPCLLSLSLPPSPILLRFERDLYWFVYHVHDEAVLVAGWGNLIKVLPHGGISRKHRVIMEKETIETRIVLKRAMEKGVEINNLWKYNSNNSTVCWKLNSILG